MKNIALVGFMGAGKSTVAEQLAGELGRPLVRTDEMIEQKEGKSINDIFREDGEPHFRRVEAQIVQQLDQREGIIIDCGGGVVTNADNIRNLKKNGVLIYLKASPEVIFQRVKHQSHRPLLNVEDPQAKIRELLAKREACYQQADFTVDTSHLTIPQVTRTIIDWLGYD